jgi:hypothetical protein
LFQSYCSAEAWSHSMSADPTPAGPARAEPRRRRRYVYHSVGGLVAVLGLYPISAYVLIPMAWSHFARHPALDDAPRITHTASGIPGDPLNIALVGSEDALVRAMLAAGWHGADPITFRSTLRITRSTLLNRPYDEAPVSNLYLWDRKQDLAFQQGVDGSSRQRHHVRFWRAAEVDDLGRPLWFGAATFDTRVGLSHTTGQVTHHIGADVDAERDQLLSDLQAAGHADEILWIDGFHARRAGRNGGGDAYHTDGRLPLVMLLTVAE